MYKVKLPGGKTLAGLEVNGNNFVSAEAVTAGDFAVLPGAVTIEYSGDGENQSAYELGEHECMELVQVKEYSDGWYFILRDVSATEYERLNAKLEYVAMMAGVEL